MEQPHDGGTGRALKDSFKPRCQTAAALFFWLRPVRSSSTCRAGRRGRRLGPVFLAGVVFWLAVFAGSPKPKVASVTLRAFHLLYPDYSQTFTVGMNQKFQLADTNLFVAIEDFVPHFAIDTVTRKVFSQSQELKNPAFKVAVFVGAEKKEEQWAFFKFAVPHFTRQTGLQFEVLKFNHNGKTYRREKSK